MELALELAVALAPVAVTCAAVPDSSKDGVTAAEALPCELLDSTSVAVTKEVPLGLAESGAVSELLEDRVGSMVKEGGSEVGLSVGVPRATLRVGERESLPDEVGLGVPETEMDAHELAVGVALSLAVREGCGLRECEPVARLLIGGVALLGGDPRGLAVSAGEQEAAALAVPRGEPEGGALSVPLGLPCGLALLLPLADALSSAEGVMPGVRLPVALAVSGGLALLSPALAEALNEVVSVAQLEAAALVLKMAEGEAVSLKLCGETVLVAQGGALRLAPDTVLHAEWVALTQALGLTLSLAVEDALLLALALWAPL